MRLTAFPAPSTAARYAVPPPGGVVAAGRPEARRLALAEVTVVEGVEAVASQELERPGQCRQPDALTRMPRPSGRSMHAEERRVLAQGDLNALHRPLRGIDEAVPGRKPGKREL